MAFPFHCICSVFAFPTAIYSCFSRIDVDVDFEHMSIILLSESAEIQWLRKSHAICACRKESVPCRTWAVTNFKTSIGEVLDQQLQRKAPSAGYPTRVGSVTGGDLVLQHQEAEYISDKKLLTPFAMLSLQLKVHIAVGIMRIKDLVTITAIAVPCPVVCCHTSSFLAANSSR